MSLEEKIANWVELGIMPYSETIQIQNRLVDMRKNDLIKDTILSVQHPVTVSFGADVKNNKFSNKLLNEVFEKYGVVNQNNILNYLQEHGVDFSISSRGGGATVFAPGQFIFYPLVDHTEITGSHSLDVGAYKSAIYRTLFNSLGNLGIREINVGSQSSFATRNERRDVWIIRDGITYKMGSKGIGINGKVAYHGFAINVTENGIRNNWMVNQCGYNPDEVKLWSVEQELEKTIIGPEVYSAVKKSIKDNFGYSRFKDIALNKLLSSESGVQYSHGN